MRRSEAHVEPRSKPYPSPLHSAHTYQRGHGPTPQTLQSVKQSTNISGQRIPKVTVATSAAARFDRFAHAAAALAHVFKPWTLDTGLAVFPPGTNGNWMRLLTIEYLARMGQPGSPRSVRIWSQAEDFRVRVRRCIEVCRNLRNADHTNGQRRRHCGVPKAWRPDWPRSSRCGPRQVP